MTAVVRTHGGNGVLTAVGVHGVLLRGDAVVVGVGEGDEVVVLEGPPDAVIS